MAANVPSTIDLTGVLLPNSTQPIYDSSEPAGNRGAGGGGEPGTVTIASADNGSVSFQGGPTVVFFDRVNQTAGTDFSLTSPEIGSYDSIDLASAGSTTHNYISANGRTWIPTRDPSRVAQDTQAKPTINFKTPGSTEIFVSYKMTAISGLIFPTATSAGQTAFPPSGNYKPVWPSDSANTDSIADIVIGTYDANGRWVSGNSCQPRYSTNSGVYFNGRFPVEGSPQLISYYQSGDESTEGANDAVLEDLTIDAEGGDLESGVGDPYNVNNAPGGISDFVYDDYFINAQLGNLTTSWVNVQAGMAYIYVAEGANARARVIVSNAATIAASTDGYILPPDTWTTSEVTYSPLAHEQLGFTHLMLADGTLLENVVTS